MRNSNIVLHESSVTRGDRYKLNKHKSVVIWFTGLSGSGKSTLSHAVEERLYDLGCRTFVLDGDNVRHGLSSNLGFSDDDRKENIRRIGEVSKLMMEAGIITLTAFISPFADDRNLVRKLLSPEDFIEIYCSASLEVCESRDVKGLYRRARNGEIENYTGVNSPYEEPINPDLVVNTEDETLGESVARVLSFLKDKGIID